MQLTPYIHALRIPFEIPVAPGVKVDRFVNCYLATGKEIVLIDTGVAGSERVIFEYIRTIGRKPEEISEILLTHAHPDHIGAARAIKEATGCGIAAHPVEVPWIEDPSLQERERPVPGFRNLVGGGVKVDRILADGDSLAIEGAGTLWVFHTPGHSGGSVSFLMPDGMALFCGDAVPVPGEIPIYEDPVASVTSLNRLKNIGNLRLLLSSWDRPRKNGGIDRAIDGGIGCIERIGREVAGIMREDRTLGPAAITARILARIGLPPTAANPLVVRTILAHMNALKGELDG